MQFVMATNGYGLSKSPTQWQNITENELLKLLALLLFFGIVKYPAKRMAWSQSNFFNSFVARGMSRNRFQQILSAWHLVNTSVYNETERNLENPFWSVQTFLDVLSKKYKEFYNQPPQNICIDEQSIPMKGCIIGMLIIDADATIL